MAANNNKNDKGDMSVRQAGQKGGQKTSQTHGREFYQEIGHEGGQRVRELVDEGKQSEDSDLNE